MSEESRATLDQFIGRQNEPQPEDPETRSLRAPSSVNRHDRLWLVIATHLRGLEQTGVVDDRSAISIASMLERLSSGQQDDTSLRRQAVSIEERVDSGLAAELTGAATLGLAYEEWTSTATRLGIRSSALAVLDAAVRMQSALIDVADLHSVSLMQGFQTGRPVQPVTFGHLLGGAIGPVGTGIARVLDQFDRLNRSSLGAGTMSGEVVGAERHDTAGWLGFGGPVPNTFDAVANVEDVVGTVELTAAIASPVARVLDEIAMLVRTDPSSFVLDDAWMREDQQLPGFSAAEGLVTLENGMRAVSTNVNSLAARMRSLPLGPLGRALDWIDAEAIHLLTQVAELFVDVESLFRTALTVNRAYLANRAGRAYTTANDLAAFLMTEEQLPPAISRNIAALTLRRLREENTEMSGITPEVVDTAAMMVIGRDLKVEMETLGRWFAPRRFLERRLVEGSPAPSKTREWLETEAERNQHASERVASRRSRVRDAEADVRKWVEEQASESKD